MKDGCVKECHEKWGACYRCCERCNLLTHTCHFCGTELYHDSTEAGGTRHWLSDCRPDLVKHEVGPECTWSYQNGKIPDCYAYQDQKTNEWTTEHVHFYKDGPMT